MSNLAKDTHRPLGKTGVAAPRVIFGTSCLGNLYEVVSDDDKVAIVAEIARHSPMPVVLDSAGKYGAGLALEVIGKSLRKLGIPASQVVISNKLGWYRVPLRGAEPTFERGVWAGIQHDAESRISYDGIRQCYEQGCDLLGAGYTPQLVSVHDPDEFLAAGKSGDDRRNRLDEILGAYRALFELKAAGAVKAVGIGAKDWRIIRELSEHVALDWVMFACSLTVYSHPPELLDFIAHLNSRGVGMVNSAVFHAGFLVGGPWFDYRKPDPLKEAPLYVWRERFLGLCRKFGANPADVCVQFGLAVPGIVSVALNTGKPERIQENARSATREIPAPLWTAMKDGALLRRDFPLSWLTMTVDSHQHFWTYDPVEYGWIDEGMKGIRRDFLPQHLPAELLAAGMDAVISVQAREDAVETQWLLELAGRHDFIAGVIGWVKLLSPRVAEELEQFAANRKMKGVRHVVQGEPDDHFILRSDFNRGVHELKKFNLVYDILIYERHLPQTISFVDMHPDQMFVLDHLAKPKIKEGAFEPWNRNLRELAKRPNVYCKASGMVTEADHNAWAEPQLRRYFAAALEAFGPKRLMFGSDWPVCLVACGYARWHKLVSSWIRDLSQDEQSRILGGTAIEAYNL